MLVALVMTLYFNLIFSLTFPVPSMLCFPLAAGPSSSSVWHHNNIKRVNLRSSGPGVLYCSFQSPRLDLLVFYIYLLSTCACGESNQYVLNSHIFLLCFTFFNSINGQKNNYCFDSRFLVIYTDLTLHTAIIRGLASFKEQLIEKNHVHF